VTTLEEAISGGRGTERPFKCTAHQDTNASASVNVLLGVWVCYACGASGKVGTGKITPSMKQIMATLEGTVKPRGLPESYLDVFDADHPSGYWSVRVGKETAKRFRCGTHPHTGAPTYPIWGSRGLLGVVTRQDGTPKYRYPHGVSTSHVLFSSHQHAIAARQRVVVLVEGAPDVMALSNVTDHLVLGVYGAGLKHPQVELVRAMAPKVVVAAFDDDLAGLLATERAEQQLGGFTKVVRAAWSDAGPYKDAGETPQSLRHQPIENALGALS